MDRNWGSERFSDFPRSPCGEYGARILLHLDRVLKPHLWPTHYMKAYVTVAWSSLHNSKSIIEPFFPCPGALVPKFLKAGVLE